MIFGRDRFGELVARQLDLFAEDEADLLLQADEALKAYGVAEHEAAEGAYGDYQLVLEEIGDRLGELRDAYAGTLEGVARAAYTKAFDRAARKRFPSAAPLL